METTRFIKIKQVCNHIFHVLSITCFFYLFYLKSYDPVKGIFLGIFFVVCSATLVFNDEKQIKKLSASPKLPLHVGRGYCILHGNPKSDESIDPGFSDQIIDFKYVKNFTNPDHEYLVPNQTIIQGLDACSLKTTVNEFRSSKSYQENLQSISKIANGQILYNVRFSLSGSQQDCWVLRESWQLFGHAWVLYCENHLSSYSCNVTVAANATVELLKRELE